MWSFSFAEYFDRQDVIVFMSLSIKVPSSWLKIDYLIKMEASFIRTRLDVDMESAELSRVADNSLGECNTILSVYTLYRHLG